MKVEDLVMATACTRDVHEAINKACDEGIVVKVKWTEEGDPDGVIVPWDYFLELTGGDADAALAD